jgi:predicted site-specific integrase-resolvase
MTKYRPEMLKAREIAAKSGIDYSTVLRWAREKKIESEQIKFKGARIPVTLVDLYSFANYAMKHYRYRKMNTRAGKRWRVSDIQNPVDRTKSAIKIKKCRLKIIQ